MYSTEDLYEVFEINKIVLERVNSIYQKPSVNAKIVEHGSLLDSDSEKNLLSNQLIWWLGSLT